MKKSIALILSLFATSVAVACGGSSDSSGGTNCSSPMSSNASADCLSCVKSSCGSQYSDYCSGKCGDNAATTSCQNAASAIGTCVIDKCSAECDTEDQSSGPNGGATNASGGATNHSGGSANSSGGAGTATTPNCVKLAECCPTLPGGDNLQVPCKQSAGYNNDGPCLGLLQAYQKAGQCTGPSTDPTVVCFADKLCTKNTVPESVKATYEMACTGRGGVVSDECPAADLLGCCTLPSSEVCTYDGADSGFKEEDCKAAQGTWTATP